VPGTTTWTVYLVRCADGSLYAGIARDLEARIDAHNRGVGARYTRSRRPVVVVWQRRRQPPRAARQLEWAIKALCRRDKERLVAGDERLWRALRRRAVVPPVIQGSPAEP
jgi:predicted GIY-YIG superfamily endonuclease